MTAKNAKLKLFQVIYRCKYCGSDMTKRARYYAENPYCSECLNERLANAQEAQEMRFGQSKCVDLGNGYCGWKPISMGG